MTPGGVDGDGFWRFSLAFYSRPGVADALLRLQDEAGRNVNLALLALWAGGVLGRVLTAAELAASEAAVRRIERDVVVPLRRLRRRLKGAADRGVEAARRKIGAVELAAERQVQLRLAASLEPSPRPAAGDRFAVAAANLMLALEADAQRPEAATLREALRRFLDRMP